MNSLIEVHEDIVVDFQTITPQILDQLKTFTFFLFYLNLCEQDSGGTAFLQVSPP